MTSPFDARPVVVAIAGPNGAGKTTFFHAHVAPAGLRLVSADVLARELSIDPYPAAALAGALRRALVQQRESFAFETVFSDPTGDELAFLKETQDAGYTVVPCFIGLGSVRACEERVAMRVMQGGHDVPADKLAARYPRVMENLKRAVRQVRHVIVYDNGDLARPFRRVAEFDAGRATFRARPSPAWLRRLRIPPP